MHDGHIAAAGSIGRSVGDFLTEPSLWVPSSLDGSSATAHVPFVSWLLEELRPKRIVRLGGRLDCSYFAMCEAIFRLRLTAKCMAVGEWSEGEAGPTAADDYREMRRRVETSYGSIAHVIRSDEDVARSRFDDASIDLLCLDARQHGPQTWQGGGAWRAKLSDRAIVLVYGLSEAGADVPGQPSGSGAAERAFTFPHGLGLGVFAVGGVAPGPLHALLCEPKSQRLVGEIQGLYARLGASLEDRYEAGQIQRLKDELTMLRQGNERLAQIGSVASRVEANTRGMIEASTVAREAFEKTLEKALKGGRRKTRATKPGGVDKVKRGRKKKPVRIAAQPRALAVPRTIRQAAEGLGEPAAPMPMAAPVDSAAPPLAPPRPEVAKTVPDDLNEVEKAMVRAVQHTREVGWLASAAAWRALWETRTVPTPVRIGKVLSSSGSIAEDFAEVSQVDKAPQGLRWCVYTTLFGGYDTLLPPRPPSSPVDFVCFSDRDFVPEGWKVIVVDAAGEPPVRAAKKLKIQPFDALSDYDASLFVDANTLVSGDVARFVERWCLHEPWVMWRHSSRSDIYDEAEAILVNQKCEPDPVLVQIDRYQREDVPRGSGLVEAGFIWRRHADEAVRACMRLWEEETGRGSPRDQLSLAYLMWKTGYRPKVFPERLGNIRANPITAIAQHRHTLGRGRVTDRPHPIAGAVRRLVFAYAPQNRSSGSTVMRGEQLAGLLRSRLPAGYEVDFLPVGEVPSDAIVVLTKGVMERISVEDLEKLSSGSIAVIGDFVDAPLRDELLPMLDTVWAASIASYRSLLRTNPSIHVDLVTHHVDPRIPRGNVAGGFSAGYFGEMVNAIRSEQIEGMVDFHPVNTKDASDDWIERLPSYSLHYAVRPRVSSRVFKPFLKGFIAARCGSNILIDRRDGDAVLYLGDDYPYLLDRPDRDNVVRGLEFAKATYGSEEWRRGLEMMREVESLSSDEHVAGEVAKSLSRF